MTTFLIFPHPPKILSHGGCHQRGTVRDAELFPGPTSKFLHSGPRDTEFKGNLLVQPTANYTHSDLSFPLREAEASQQHFEFRLVGIHLCGTPESKGTSNPRAGLSSEWGYREKGRQSFAGEYTTYIKETENAECKTDS